MQPVASIIIVSYNCAGDIGACISALERLHLTEPYEIIVVDNASSDGTPELIRTQYPSVCLLPQQENWGFAGAVNRGVRTARGAHIALLNPDAIARPDWLTHLVAAFDDPQIGVVGSKVLGKDGRLQSVGSVLATPLILPAYRGDGESDHGQYDTATDVWSVHGAAMAFRRELWEQVGGFDEGYYPAYLEESDFCEQARQAGYRVVTAPQAVAVHAEASSTGKDSAQFFYYFHRNRLRYAIKWLSWAELWGGFRPAEHARLHTAPLRDRRVARLVYEQGILDLQPPDAAQRAAVRATGQALREGMLPDDGIGPLLTFLEEVQEQSIHHEVRFRSALPLVARLRTTWNNIATRWYVRPNLDQQTRYNLAMERAFAAMLQRTTAEAACQALDVALLAWSQRATIARK